MQGELRKLSNPQRSPLCAHLRPFSVSTYPLFRCAVAFVPQVQEHCVERLIVIAPVKTGLRVSSSKRPSFSFPG